MSILHGKIDNFAAGGDSQPTPSDPLKIQFPQLVSQAANNIFDNTGINYLFGDTLFLNALPIGSTITVARVSTRLKPNSGDGSSSAGNDTFSFQSGGSRFGYSLKDQPANTSVGRWGNNVPSQAGGVNFTFTFTTVANPANTTSPYPANFLALIANTRMLDILEQDDTSVDYVQLDLCYKPPAKYDLVASKKHDGNVYSLNVHNNGQQIMPTGHVDVVEVVPAGLTITSFPSGPWTCTGLLPVVGPDSFTCSYQIPGGGIAVGANLPQIVLKSEGTPECPNCMRVKLYLKEFEGGVKPVNEGDMKNNVSCVK
jgi:hypothetical protein